MIYIMLTTRKSDFKENGIQTDLKSVRDFLVGLKNPQDFSGVKGMESHCS
jgi:hypothetical protein